MKPDKITEKENEVILCCPHIENVYEPQIFILEMTKDNATVLWLCNDCHNTIGRRWVEEVLTIRIKPR